MRLEWQLDDDGGGEVLSFKKGLNCSMVPVVKEQEYVFDSLDGLPEQWAEAIKADGRRQGKLEIADELESGQ